MSQGIGLTALEREILGEIMRRGTAAREMIPFPMIKRDLLLRGFRAPDIDVAVRSLAQRGLIDAAASGLLIRLTEAGAVAL